MFGRREFGIAGLSAVAIAALEGASRGQEKQRSAHAEHDDMLSKCAKACSDCQRECDSCATHCAHVLSSGHKEHLTTLMTCRDCAVICAAASQVVAAGGPFSATICEACAKACADCAKACEKFPDDKHMKECAEECRRCEKACKEMLAHKGH